MKETNVRKAKPIEGLKKFKVSEADEIFFNMPTKGWIPNNHDFKKMRYCTSYVYEFVFHLNGKCPAKEKWPQPFLDEDRRAATDEHISLNYQMVSVFSDEYANNYHQKFTSQTREEEGKECAIKELEIQILMIKGEKWHLMEQKEKKEIEGKLITGFNLILCNNKLLRIFIRL